MLIIIKQQKLTLMYYRFYWIFALISAFVHSGVGASISPTWISSELFKAGAVTFAYSSGAVTNQTATVTYASAITNSALKNPVLGITDLNYQISSQLIELLVIYRTRTTTSLTFQVKVNTNSCLKLLKLTYLTIDNDFAPAVSLNYVLFNPGVVGPGLVYQTYVNFTASTGVTLNTSHENVIQPFLHYMKIASYDNTIDINLDFKLLNSSFYNLTVRTTSNMLVSTLSISRMIFDKTAIEAMGVNYFDYGVIASSNNNNSALSVIIPPSILPSNLFYGMHSFSIVTGISQLNFNSSYDIATGFLGYSSNGTYIYSEMKFSFFHHKQRTCPPTHPYYNISQKLCYDQCQTINWFSDNSSMFCTKCLYDCYSCTDNTSCSFCNVNATNRQTNGTRCPALPGYFDDGINLIAQPCNGCLTCVTSASNCVTCPANQLIVNSTCLPCSYFISNCADCTSQANCTACQASFTLYSATNCSCGAMQFVSAGRCSLCSAAIAHCSACVDSTSCTLCENTFSLLTSQNCSCTSTQFLNTTAGQCQSCSSALPNCLICESSNNCTKCASNYAFNASIGACTYFVCQVQNCEVCVPGNSKMCMGCFNGYSVSSSGVCQKYCGNYALDSNQQCDDGNSIQRDGCSLTCNTEADFKCQNITVNNSNIHTYCFFSAKITFSNLWIRKIQGQNAIKCLFKLDRPVNQWKTVNFTQISRINYKDSDANNSRLLANATAIKSYLASYQPQKNRFWVIIIYASLLESKTLTFELKPYQNGIYPTFTPTQNAQFVPEPAILNLQIIANNNQKVDLYSTKQYELYSMSVITSYTIVTLAILALLLSFIFRAGRIIVLEMIFVIQITYFSLPFIDSMNVAFSGMLSLRYLAGVLTFQDIQKYLEQTTAPNCMKGVYMSFSLPQNLSWASLTFFVSCVFGLLLALVYKLQNKSSGSQELGEKVVSAEKRKCQNIDRLSIYLLGETSLTLIILFLPIYTVSLFYQFIYSLEPVNALSYTYFIGFAIAAVIYFVALIKSDLQQCGNESSAKLGQFIEEFSSQSTFKCFKYYNFQMVEILVMAFVAMLTINRQKKLFSPLGIILISIIDIIIVGVTKPYRFRFVSGNEPKSGRPLKKYQKIEISSISTTQVPNLITVCQVQPGFVNQQFKSEDNKESINDQSKRDRPGQDFVEEEKQEAKKLSIFNNNTRRIINLLTLVLIEFCLICVNIFAEELSKSYQSVTINNSLPLLVQLLLIINICYNYIMLFLQVFNSNQQSCCLLENNKNQDEIKSKQGDHKETSQKIVYEQMGQLQNTQLNMLNLSLNQTKRLEFNDPPLKFTQDDILGSLQQTKRLDFNYPPSKFIQEDISGSLYQKKRLEISDPPLKHTQDDILVNNQERKGLKINETSLKNAQDDILECRQQIRRLDTNEPQINNALDESQELKRQPQNKKQKKLKRTRKAVKIVED